MTASHRHRHKSIDIVDLDETVGAGFQPLDDTLTALAAISGTGLIEQTGIDTFAKRTIGVGSSTSLPTRSDADTRYAASSHTHAESDVTNLVSDLAGKAAASHTHAQSDVTSLVSDLAAKAPLSGTLAQFAATTSAQLASVISDETGTDKVVFNTSPTLVTPVLGTPASGTITNLDGIHLWEGYCTSTTGASLTTSFANVTNATISVAIGTYQFEFYVVVDADATTTGIDVGVNGPTTSALWYIARVWTAAGTTAENYCTAYDTNTAVANSAGTAKRAYHVHGVATFTAAGTLAARAKRENVGSAATHASWGRVRRVS